MAIKPLAIKVTAGIIGTGGAIAIAHQGYQALQNKPKEETKESNRNKLISQKYQILSTEQEKNVTWQAILDSYKKVIQEHTNLTFEGFTGTEADKALATLKNKCEEALNSKEETLLNKAKKWCTVPTSVTDALKGRRILRTDNNKDNEEDQNDWNEKIKSYTKTANKKGIPEIVFTGRGEINEPTKNDRDIVRGACKKLNEKKSYEGDYEISITKSETWCTVDK